MSLLPLNVYADNSVRELDFAVKLLMTVASHI